MANGQWLMAMSNEQCAMSKEQWIMDNDSRRDYKLSLLSEIARPSPPRRNDELWIASILQPFNSIAYNVISQWLMAMNNEPFTRYRSPITRYRSPITRYRLPITRYRLPITLSIHSRSSFPWRFLARTRPFLSRI